MFDRSVESWPNGWSYPESRSARLPVTHCHPPPPSGPANIFLEMLTHTQRKRWSTKWNMGSGREPWVTTIISPQAMKTDLGNRMQMNSFTHMFKRVEHYPHNQGVKDYTDVFIWKMGRLTSVYPHLVHPSQPKVISKNGLGLEDMGEEKRRWWQKCLSSLNIYVYIYISKRRGDKVFSNSQADWWMNTFPGHTAVETWLGTGYTEMLRKG